MEVALHALGTDEMSAANGAFELNSEEQAGTVPVDCDKPEEFARRAAQQTQPEVHLRPTLQASLKMGLANQGNKSVFPTSVPLNYLNSSLGRATASRAGGRKFESTSVKKKGRNSVTEAPFA